MNTSEITTHKILRNISFNSIGYIYPMLLAFIIAPITVNALGIRNYGLYVLLSTMLSLIGLLDLGISTGVNRFITKHHSNADKTALQKLIGSANFIFLIVGVCGFALFILAILFGNFFISEELINYPNYQLAILFAGILFLITSSTTLFSIIPSALNRFDISNKVGLVTITLQQISIAVAVLHGATIPQIFLIGSIMAIISSSLNMYVSHKLLPDVPLFQMCIDRKEIVSFYKFGISSFINNIANSSLTYLDRIIVPFLLGPSNLTYYSLSGNVASKTSGFANVMSSTLFPLTTYLDSTNNIEKIKLLYMRSTRLLFILSASIVITMISFSYEILNYWINNDLAEKASGILIILAITNLVLSSTSPISNILLGIGKLRYLTINSIIMATLNILLIFMLAPKFGLTGIAWAYLLSLLPLIWLIHKVEKSYLKLENRFRFYVFILSKISFVSLIIYSINNFLLKGFIDSLFILLIILPISIGLFLVLYFFFGFFDKQDIHDIKKFLRLI